LAADQCGAACTVSRSYDVSQYQRARARVALRPGEEAIAQEVHIQGSVELAGNAPQQKLKASNRRSY
jgi:hypothetical protein